MVNTAVTGKYLQQRTKFEKALINARREMWVGKDTERVHSRKALLIAKRIADLMDNQQRLWPKGTGDRFETNRLELDQRMLQVQFYLLELARELQEDIEAERLLKLEGKGAAQQEKEELVRARKDLILAKKLELETKLHHATKRKAVKALRKEICIDLKKLKAYNEFVQASGKLLDINREVLDKINNILHERVGKMQRQSAVHRWTDAQQEAHIVSYFCKKIDDDIMGKQLFAATIGKLIGRTRKLRGARQYLQTLVA